MKRLGFIGLGEMGQPMAVNLINQGFPLTVFDLNPEPVDRLKALGAKAAANPEAVAEHADCVIVIVRTTDQVQEVLFGQGGITSATSPPSTVIVMSTISPVDAAAMADGLKDKGIAFLDAPCSGARRGAEAGELTIMVGGEEGCYLDALPVLEVLGGHIVRLGEAGAGQYAKLINNMLLLINMCAAHEAKSLADAAGLDQEAIFDLIKVSTGQSWVLDNWPTVFGWKQDYVAGGTLDILYKDIDMTLALGEKQKVPLHLSSLAKQLVRY